MPAAERGAAGDQHDPGRRRAHACHQRHLRRRRHPGRRAQHLHRCAPLLAPLSGKTHTLHPFARFARCAASACVWDKRPSSRAERSVGGCAGTIVGISVAILVCLFAGQRAGTSKVGFTFAPVIILWYTSNVMINLYNIITYYPGGGSPHACACAPPACKISAGRSMLLAAAEACVQDTINFEVFKYILEAHD